MDKLWAHLQIGVYDHCAWRLVRARVKCVGDAKKLAKDIDGSAPDLFLKGRTGNHTSRTSIVTNAGEANWLKTDIVFWAKKDLTIDVCDSEPLGQTKLHSFLIPSGDMPPERFIARPEKEWFWDAQFEWQSVHY